MVAILSLIFFNLLAIASSDQFPGGLSTSNDWSEQAFNHPATKASSIEKQFFGVGNSFFKQSWVEFPSSTIGRDGLGPTYNAVACASCHVKDGRGIAFDGNLVNLSLLFRLSKKVGDDYIPHPEYGDQFQPFGITTVQGEGDVEVEFETIHGQYPDGETFELVKPLFEFKNFKLSPFDEWVLVSPRVAPHLIGLGFIEAIPSDQIIQREDPLDSDGDGISGKANWVFDLTQNQMTLGRFGWKAGQPSLRQQNAAAFNGDMGLTSEVFPEQNCPLVQTDCWQAPTPSDLEVSPKVLDRVTLYTQLIAVPKARNYGSSKFINGKRIFTELHCTQCHQPHFQTGGSHPIQALRNQLIWPYSDFLLHDMGEGLADHRPDGFADGQEWRTPPLWGLGLIETVNRHSRLLHDGRARNIEEAILWHDGEAFTHKKAFMNLNKKDRQILIDFIKSI